MTADLDLDALTALEQAATPGPWIAASWGVETVPDFDLHRFDVMSETVATIRLNSDDAALIAAMRNNLPALIDAARERDKQFTLAEHALGALETADEVLNKAAGLDAEHAHDLDYRDEVVLGLRAELDAAHAELAALRERLADLDVCDRCGRTAAWSGSTAPGAPCMGCGRYPAALTTGGDRG